MEPRPSPAALLGRTLVLATVLGLPPAALLTRARLVLLDEWSPALLWRLGGAHLNAALVAAVAAVLAWLVLFALAGRITPVARLRSLAATAVVAAPGALWLALWVNRHMLPDLWTVQSLLGNLTLAAGLFASLFVAAAFLRRWRERAHRGARLWLLVLAAPVIVNALALRSTPRGPNAIVILIDVLGARHMSCYGYERETTPNLDRFARDAVLFEQAVAQSSFTKTSVASLFTGLWPHHHGVYVGDHEDQGGDLVADPLPRDHTTLAESLQRAGYLTAAWVRNDQLKSWMGFDQGFGLYDDEPGDLPRIASELLAWLAAWRDEGPFFAYLHVLDLHGPYRPAPPFDERFGRYSDREPFDWRQWNDYKSSIVRGEYSPPPEEVEQLRAWHDGQLAWVDEQLGVLLERLRGLGVYDESLIVVTADHGDGFMQHGFVSHSNTPFEELIHVPLVVKLPRSREAGRRVADPVALADLAPTLEELLGAGPRIARSSDGASLARLLEGGAPPAREWIVSEYRDRKAFRSDRWKYIQTGRHRWLFDLRADPGETEDVLAEHPELGDELAGRTRVLMKERLNLEEQRVKLDDEMIQELTELGYL